MVYLLENKILAHLSLVIIVLKETFEGVTTITKVAIIFAYLINGS